MENDGTLKALSVLLIELASAYLDREVDGTESMVAVAIEIRMKRLHSA